MAIDSLCAVEGCGKTISRRGWCSAHYSRFIRHGDPLAGGNGRGHVAAYLQEVVLTYAGDDCLIWPFSRHVDHGRAQIRVGGKTRSVHRIVCEHVNGPTPSSDHQAAHSCGRGHEGCVSPRHLDWKTPSENNGDKVRHGTAPRGERSTNRKLSAIEVEQIRALRGAFSQNLIAGKFGIAQATVSKIQIGKRWQHQPSL